MGKLGLDGITALQRLLKNPYQPVHSMGLHTCELCAGHSEARNLVIPFGELLFIAPAMVGHYVTAHSYLPPPSFVSAALDCPDQDSPEFLELIASFSGLWASGPTTGSS